MGGKMWLVNQLMYRIAHYMVQLFAWATAPFFSMWYESLRSERIPAPDPLMLKSATELAHMIRSRQVTSRQVVEASIGQIKAVNGKLNAVVVDRFEDALREADAVDACLNGSEIPDKYSQENAPFLGVPFTAKEAFGIVGLPNTSGLLSRRRVVADRDADAVAKMRGAGAIPVGLTNCSELCMWYESSNLIYGRSNNAYHQGRMVGGSSGGEACIVSSAGSVFGVGSDIGGSIRMPAFFNGIFGHKPSRGIVSNRGQFPNAIAEAQTFLSTGPLCRYAADLAPMLKVMAGPDGVAQLDLDRKVDLKKVKFYYMEDDGGGFLVNSVDPQIKAAVKKAATHFEQLGAHVERVNLWRLKHSFFIWAVKMATSGNETFCSLMGGSVREVNPWVELGLWLVGRPRHTLPAIGLGLGEKFPNPPGTETRMRAMCDSLREELVKLLGDDGVFLYPTHPRPAPYHNQPLTMIFNFAYTGVFNTLGLPATHVPMGLAQPQGVPIGVQVVGAPLQDRLNLAVARELEQAFGGWVPPFKV